MNELTPELKEWCSDFGRSYTDRNYRSTMEEIDQLYLETYGRTRTQMNQQFFGAMDKTISILEVGCNVGCTLLGFQKMGFGNLVGIEPQSYAVEKARALTGVSVSIGNAFDLRFEDQSFDLVFTSGVLVHINPTSLLVAIDEIHRCSRKWIWGFESFSEQVEPIPYRDKLGLYWRADFAKLYLDRFPDLELVHEERIKRLGDGNVDTAFLLRKKTEE